MAFQLSLISFVPIQGFIEFSCPYYVVDFLYPYGC